MATRARQIAVGLCALLLVGCGARTGGALVTLEAGDDRPFFVTMNWLGDKTQGQLLTPRRLPGIGSFPPSGRELTTVFIEQGGAALGARRIFVLGKIDDVEYWGSARVSMVEGVTTPVTVVVQKRPLQDADADGVPDEIDECPGADDLSGC